MGLKTFKVGGIHPPENKLAKDSPIEELGLPEKVSIPLSQHLGAPAIPVVQKGDKVKVGTRIAKSGGFISADIHSSVSGTVLKIDAIHDPSGYPKQAVMIKVEGDEWEPSIDRSPELIREIPLSPQEIIARQQEAGIVGLGGATFPTHVKYMLPEGKTADTLIVNAVECEPYLSADHRIMLEKADEILVGIEIMKKALGVKRALIGIENNKADAIELLQRKAGDHPGISVVALAVKYPQGAEKQLIKALVGREVPSGRLPLDVGCVVNNVGTALSIYEAVQKNQPLIRRVVTVAGKKLQRSANFLVRIGTPFSMLIDAVGGMPEGTTKIISGGPMMGKAVGYTDIPVTKGTSGILLLDQKDARRRECRECLRCGKCVEVCPMGIEPYLLEKLAEHSRFEDCEAHHILDCIECGSCSFICPASRPILDLIRLGKANVARIQRERKHR